MIDLIIEAAAKVDVALNDEQASRLAQYHALLVKWNKAYNLTAIRDPLQMISRHIADGLTLAPYIQSDRILDVGTGAGIPGMILALTQPDQQWALLDSNGKKTRFLNQVCMELNVKNVEVVSERVEHYAPEQKFKQITSRAFKDLGQMVSWCEHLLVDGGEFIAMKGQIPEQEIADVSAQWNHSVIALPGPEEARHLVTLTRKN